MAGRDTVQKTYMGLDEDLKTGLGPTAKIILDAKVFGLIGDDENCQGWSAAQVQVLYDQVSKLWQDHGMLPSRLPEDLRKRHAQIFDAAVARARGYGWDPDRDVSADESR